MPARKHSHLFEDHFFDAIRHRLGTLFSNVEPDIY